MNKYREALENLKQRINTKENMPIVEELVRATEIVESDRFWGIEIKRDKKPTHFEPICYVAYHPVIIEHKGKIALSFAFFDLQCICSLDRVFLTEAEAKAKADELNKGGKL